MMKGNCRLCEQEQESLIPLFGTGHPKQNRLPLMVSVSTGLEVELCDRLPKYICQACHDQLEQSYRLSIQCRNMLRKELEHPRIKFDSRCLTCGALLHKKSMQANVSAEEKWGKSISSMMQYLSCALKEVKDLRGQNFWLACDGCLEKMDHCYKFKERCLKSEANWLQELSYPWEKMEVDSSNLNQLVVDLFAEVVQDRNNEEMFYCSVCSLKVELQKVGDKCEGCRLEFRNVLNQEKTENKNAAECPQTNEASMKDRLVTKKSSTKYVSSEEASMKDLVIKEKFPAEYSPKGMEVRAIEEKSSSEYVETAETNMDDLILNETISEVAMIQDDLQTVNDIVIEEIIHEEIISETVIDESHIKPRYTKHDQISHKCCCCDKTFISSKNLQIHYDLKHKNTKHTELPENSCKYCLEQFDVESELLQHRDRRIYSAWYECQFERCSYISTEGDKMETHCSENPHKVQSNTESSPDIKHFDIIGTIDDCIDILKAKSDICCRCYKTFDSTAEKKAHLQTHLIQDDFPFHCEVCGRGFVNKINLAVHNNIRRHRKHYFCRLCNQFLWLKTVYISHVALYHFPAHLEDQIEKEMDDYVTCCGCKERFDTEEDIVEHRKEKHPPTPDPTTRGRIKCNYCQLILTASAMSKHVATFENRESYRCMVPYCAFRTKRIGHMRLHTYAGKHHNSDGEVILRNNTSIATKLLHCCIRSCGYTNTEYEPLTEHFKENHSAKREYYTIYYSSREFKCVICTKGFDNKRTLVDHLYKTRYFYCKVCDTRDPISERTAHADCQKKTPPSDMVQNKTNKGQKTKENKSKAKNYNFARHVCHICGKKVKNLDDHMASHENKRNWECHICHKRFNNNTLAKKHQRVHDGIRKYACRQGCAKTYKAQPDRNRHEKLVHLGIKPFECKYCSSAFVRDRDLRLHSRKHTGQKLFPCTRCDEGFDKKAEYDQHMEECIEGS